MRPIFGYDRPIRNTEQTKQNDTVGLLSSSSSFLSSISVLTMRLLQDSSRPLCFWSLHQSWSSRCFFSFRSSLTLSIQVFICLSLLLFPSTCPCKAAFGSLFCSILSTCPNHSYHCSLLFLIFCTTVSSAISSSLVCSFLTFSLLRLLTILLSQLISATITAFARSLSSDSNILSRTARLALPRA